ncbi:radical SAM protein, partial [Enterococcus faecium]
TTNATQLATVARDLHRYGIRRLNISLDSLDHERFRAITRRGDLDQVLAGIAAAQDAGLAVKINMVALKALNEDEIGTMVGWCGERG